ncbi:hypothetical protein E6R60_26365 [Streptomyces sp. A0642]|uniref:hypothetical protein n=1 Tax=Streptomyces sp. A0642 TaxID=2563100 RepID=UPI0010A21672|nr:hypothetical protein [Streptomyces sp. A0642]THA72458.1 hypothetical protein E6R60_26365 [Streptomyces sp. A0642]
MNDYWNYLLGGLDIVGLVALRAVGQKKAVGWLWAMLTQAVWIVYSIATFQWGFLAVAVIKLAVYSWNWVSWVRSDKAEAQKPEIPLWDQAEELVRNNCPNASIVDRAKYTEVIFRLLTTADVLHGQEKAKPIT